MGKKGLPGETPGEDPWQEREEAPPGKHCDPFPSRDSEKPPGKPSRRRIEEYLERKRLEQVLQEEVDEDIFDA